MKKLIIILSLMLATTTVVWAAATTDFVADNDITVKAVTFGVTTADMLIMSGSGAQSWTFNGGTFTVLNPDSSHHFRVGSADTSVKSIMVKDSGATTVACGENTTVGTSYVDLPLAADTYTITPSTTTDCESLCTTVSYAASYNAFPICGAASCNSGYRLSGSGATATCIRGVASSASGGGSAPVSPVAATPATPTTPATSVGEVSTTPGVPATDASGNVTISQITSDAQTVLASNVTTVVEAMGVSRDTASESKYQTTILPKITTGQVVSEATKTALVNFITYGTKATKVLGAGERAGVVNSFKAAFGKLPTTETDWTDVVKIANGRWPSQTSTTKETAAKAEFKKIYLRNANMAQPNDNAAVTVISYGLRPAIRNTNSEKAAIKSFKAIYGYNPTSATNWDVVRAVAYSGAKR